MAEGPPHAIYQTPRVLVLGGGVIGLQSALAIMDRLPRAKVTVMADRFDFDTTSWGAGALYRPVKVLIGPTPEITRRWYTDAYVYYRDLSKSAESAEAGVMEVPAYYLFADPKNDPTRYLSTYFPNVRHMTKDEMNLVKGNYVGGAFNITYTAYMPDHLKWLAKKVQQKGGRIEVGKKLNTFLELDGSQVDLVVNCTGLGSAVLCDDPLLIPVRGHLLKMSAPWIRAAFFDDDDRYIIPTPGCVTVGGSRQFGSSLLKIKEEDGDQILERALEFVPALKGAEIQCHWVGLRPYRGLVRAEKATVVLKGGKTVPIVHNYGHGSSGMSVGPGAAKYCAKLVEQALSGDFKNVPTLLSYSKL